MKRKNFYFAQLHINDDTSNDLLRVFVDSPTEFELNRSPKTLTVSNSSSITELTLELQGFDTVERSSNNIDLIKGEVYLCIKQNDVITKHLLQSPKINIIGLDFDKKISITKQLNSFKELIQTTWQNAFINAQPSPYLNKKNPAKALKHDSKTFLQNLRFTKISSNLGFVKLLSLIIAGLVVLFLSLSVYEKSLKVQAQKISNNNVDPSMMVSEHDELLNKAFKDMGIDRSKITNDLSCFAE